MIALRGVDAPREVPCKRTGDRAGGGAVEHDAVAGGAQQGQRGERDAEILGRLRNLVPGEGDADSAGIGAAVAGVDEDGAVAGRGGCRGERDAGPGREARRVERAPAHRRARGSAAGRCGQRDEREQRDARGVSRPPPVARVSVWEAHDPPLRSFARPYPMGAAAGVREPTLPVGTTG